MNRERAGHHHEEGSPLPESSQKRVDVGMTSTMGSDRVVLLAKNGGCERNKASVSVS